MTYAILFGLITLVVALVAIVAIRRRQTVTNALAPGVKGEATEPVRLERPEPRAPRDVKATLVLMAGGASHRMPIQLGSGSTRFGRDRALAHVVLPDRSVSRLHASIAVEPGPAGEDRYVVYDEGSTSGTYVNGQPVDIRGQSLQHGDTIHLGPVGMVFHIKDHEPILDRAGTVAVVPALPEKEALEERAVKTEIYAPVLPPPQGGDAGGPQPVARSAATLLVLHIGRRGEKPRSVPLHDGSTLFVGRETDCDVVLVDRLVSRRHCEIRCEPNGAVIYDLGSSNGTYLDGVQLNAHQPVIMRPESVLRISSYHIRLEAISPALPEIVAASAEAPAQAEAREPEPHELRRFAAVYFPGKCRLDQPIRLRLQLANKPVTAEPDPTVDEPRSAPTDEISLEPTSDEVKQQRIDLLVFVAANGFDADPRWQKLPTRLDPNAPEAQSVEFQLTGRQSGQQKVEVEVFHGANRVSYVMLKTQVIDVETA